MDIEEKTSPVYHVKAVPVEKVCANNYNPNVVAPPEMKLLELSIWEDGFTMPCVCYYDKENDKYIIVDGFNRARGTHDIGLMTNIVAELTQAGMSDKWIMKNIGMDKDELLRLKQVSGLASLFADNDFSIPTLQSILPESEE